MLHYFNISLEKWKTHTKTQTALVLPALLLGSFLFLLVALSMGPCRLLWLQPQVPESASTPKRLKMNTVEYGWITCNWMKLMQTESNLNLVEANGCKWTNNLHSFAGLQRTLKRYLLYPSIKITWIHKPPTHQHYWKVQLCATLPHTSSWPLHFLWPLRQPLFLPRLVLALLLLWALLRLEQPANICEPKNWHTSKIIGTTTRETTQTGLSVPKTKAQGSLQGHYKVMDRAS